MHWSRTPKSNVHIWYPRDFIRALHIWEVMYRNFIQCTTQPSSNAVDYLGCCNGGCRKNKKEITDTQLQKKIRGENFNTKLKNKNFLAKLSLFRRYCAPIPPPPPQSKLTTVSPNSQGFRCTAARRPPKVAGSASPMLPTPHGVGTRRPGGKTAPNPPVKQGSWERVPTSLEVCQLMLMLQALVLPGRMGG